MGDSIPKGVWHTLEAIDPNSGLFECQEGSFVPHEEDGDTECGEEMIVKILKGVWAFCSYLYVPQWGRRKGNE